GLVWWCQLPWSRRQLRRVFVRAGDKPPRYSRMLSTQHSALSTQHSSCSHLQAADLLPGHVGLVPVEVAVPAVELDSARQSLRQPHARLPAQFAPDLLVAEVDLTGVDGPPLRR